MGRMSKTSKQICFVSVLKETMAGSFEADFQFKPLCCSCLHYDKAVVEKPVFHGMGRGIVEGDADRPGTLLVYGIEKSNRDKTFARVDNRFGFDVVAVGLDGFYGVDRVHLMGNRVIVGIIVITNRKCAHQKEHSGGNEAKRRKKTGDKTEPHHKSAHDARLSTILISSSVNPYSA